MDAVLSLKNRYWVLIILPVLLFLPRYYIYFVLRAPILEDEGIEDTITFQSFFIYNYILGVIIMFLFLFVFFLLLKGTSFLWSDMDNKKLLKTLLVSYCVFFIPDIATSINFTIFQAQYRIGEIKEFRRGFFLERETNVYELDGNTWRTILASIGYMDLAFFALIAIILHLLFDDLSPGTILTITLILAAIFFSFKVALPLLTM